MSLVLDKYDRIFGKKFPLWTVSGVPWLLIYFCIEVTWYVFYCNRDPIFQKIITYFVYMSKSLLVNNFSNLCSISCVLCFLHENQLLSFSFACKMTLKQTSLVVIPICFMCISCPSNGAFLKLATFVILTILRNKDKYSILMDFFVSFFFFN